MAVKILGHRGINQPENKNLPYQNTIEAFNYAFEKGADGIELDVITSKDSKCFVIHDDDISVHGAGKGLITQMTADEIKTRKINGKYDIPALSDVLEAFSKSDKLINIEIKQPGIAKLVLREIVNSKFPHENLLISSFNQHDLFEFRSLNKDIKIGVLFGKETRNDKHFEKQALFNAEQLEPSVFCMEKTLPYIAILESEKEKYIWTIKKEDMENYIVEGLMMYKNMNFFTDYPQELAKAIKK